MKFCAKNLCKTLLSVLFLLFFSGTVLAQTADDSRSGAAVRPGFAPSSVSTNHIKDRAVTGRKLANGAVTSEKIRDGAVQLGDMDPSIAGQIAKSAFTNAEQDRAIYNNAGKISAQKESIATLQTAVNGLSSGAGDSADGVEITFARQFEHNTGSGPVPAIDLNGTALKINSNEPTVTLGGQARRVLASGAIPDTSPQLQQVIVDLPATLLGGSHKLKLSNARGDSEVFIPLSGIAPHDGRSWTRATANAAFPVRSGPEVLSYNGKLWIIGGYWGNHSNNDVWSSADGVNWTQVTAHADWPARNLFASVVHDNKMWVMGGNADIFPKNFFNDVWHSTDGANWTRTTASAAWPARSNFDAVSFNNKLWVLTGFAGYGVSAFSDVWSSSDGINWTRTSTGAFPARHAASALAFDNKLWIMGGTHGGRDVWSSPDGANWTRVTANAAWSPRYGASVVAYGGRMWRLGSYQNHGTEVWSSSDGRTWSLATGSPGWRYRYNNAVVLKRRVWLVGGFVLGSNKSDVWRTSR